MCRWSDSAPGHQEYPLQNANPCGWRSFLQRQESLAPVHFRFLLTWRGPKARPNRPIVRGLHLNLPIQHFKESPNCIESLSNMLLINILRQHRPEYWQSRRHWMLLLRRTKFFFKLCFSSFFFRAGFPRKSSCNCSAVEIWLSLCSLVTHQYRVVSDIGFQQCSHDAHVT